jgi:D-alanine-D-alanine ligase
MTPLHVVVLHQAISAASPPDELDVLDEVRAIRAALRTLGHRVTVLPMTASLDDMRRALQRARPACVFNLVETLLGYGGLAAAATALLDSLGFAYTGASTAALALTTNKVLTKRALLRAEVATPAWITAREQHGFRPATYVIKPISEDASVGLDEDSLVHIGTLAEGRREIDQRSQKLGRALFAERFVEGREFNLSLIGSFHTPQVLPVAELLFHGFKERRKPTIVGYRAKWEPASFEYQNTRRTFATGAEDRQLQRSLREIARTAWTIVGCSGYARVDLRVDKQGRPHVLEINANPCIAPDSGFIAAADRAGLDYSAVVAEILTVALASGSRSPSSSAGSGYRNNEP